jgi:hypothetical protein
MLTKRDRFKVTVVEVMGNGEWMARKRQPLNAKQAATKTNDANRERNLAHKAWTASRLRSLIG